MLVLTLFEVEGLMNQEKMYEAIKIVILFAFRASSLLTWIIDIYFSFIFLQMNFW